jgi:uncharacterized protein HemY
MAKRKTKRDSWWLVVGAEDTQPWVCTSKAQAKDMQEEGDRVAKLREVTPAEEAVLRAARAYVAGGDWGTEDALVRAVERMEKDDE